MMLMRCVSCAVTGCKALPFPKHSSARRRDAREKRGGTGCSLKGCRGMAASAPDAAAPRCGSRAAVMKRTLEDAARAAAEHAAEWFGSGGWDLRGLLNGREELTLRAPCSHRVRTSLHDLIHCLRRSVARSHGATVSSGARLLLEARGVGFGCAARRRAWLRKDRRAQVGEEFARLRACSAMGTAREGERSAWRGGCDEVHAHMRGRLRGA